MADAPELVGRYRILKPLGRGRLGDLYLAIDPALERDVAVRVVPFLPTDRRKRFEQTVRSIAQLRYQGLAPIFYYGDHEGRFFFTREYVKGQALAQLISLKAPISPANRLELMVTVCEVLAYAHQRGEAGLAVEPSDIIVGPQGEGHIVDLSLAPLVEDASVNGNPSYLSPETIGGHPRDPRSDVFTAGVLLYELFTYEKPFGRASAHEIRKRIADGARWIPHHDLDPALAAIVARALQFEIAARYQTVEALLADLRRLRTWQVHEPPASVIVPASQPASAPSIPRSVERQELSRKHSKHLEGYLAEARAALENQDYERALEGAERAVALYPDNSQALEIRKRLLEALRARETQARKVHRADDIRVDDNVRFTVYRPPAMVPQRWYPLLIYAHLGERRPDAPPDEPDPIAQVEASARALLGPAASRFQRIVNDASAGIPHQALLRIVPSVPGLTFNPPELSFLWTESMHKADFRIQASASLLGRVARGSIDVRIGALSVALITIAIPIDAGALDEKPQVSDEFQAYRRIFASYSHKDTAIVRQFENYARGMGDSYLRDVIDLRAGEIWSDRLLEMIDAADVFQLFWSNNSLGSPFVRREWEHALTVNKSNFVRPLYWESPLPERDGLPPPALKARHFASVAVTDVPTADKVKRRLEEEVDRERPDHEVMRRTTVREHAAREQQAPEDTWEREATLRPQSSRPVPLRFPMASRIGVVTILVTLLGFLLTRCW